MENRVTNCSHFLWISEGKNCLFSTIRIIQIAQLLWLPGLASLLGVKHHQPQPSVLPKSVIWPGL